nr:FtsX-like permease family protein [Bacteroidales bacterium]
IADQYDCSPEFYDLMDIRFVEGRAPRDSSEVVVDEKFVQKMAEFTDWSDGAVGKQVFITGHGKNAMMDKGYFTISGVYKSYLIGNLRGVNERPSALFYGEIGSMSTWMPHILFKVRPDALEKVHSALYEALPDKEINIVSYAEEMRAAYADSKKMRNTMALGAVFSLLIALLGLIGFIKDESLRRSKEMAVRKINGATTRDILGVFATDIMKLSAVMAVIACVAAYFVAHKWLEQFAEKVSLNPLYFIGGALLVLTIVLGVVVLNCLRIARANPVESLKNE